MFVHSVITHAISGTTDMKLLTPDSLQKLRRLLVHNEKFRQFPYDDATGLPVHAPKGNITWLIGLNVSDGEDIEFAYHCLDYKLAKIEVELLKYTHDLSHVSQVRMIVLFDMAYNLGVAGLMAFRALWTAIYTSNWQAAATAMANSAWDGEVSGRAKVDEQMMLHDEWCGL